MNLEIDNTDQPDVTKFPLNDDELAELVRRITSDPDAMRPVSESLITGDEKLSSVVG